VYDEGEMAVELRRLQLQRDELLRKLNVLKIQLAKLTGIYKVWSFEIPSWTMPSRNKMYSRGHWTARKKIVDEVHEMVMAYAQDLPKPIEGQVNITITAYRRRMVDADNVDAKPVIDGLRQCGVLTDDDKAHVNMVSTSCEKVPIHPHTDVLIERIGEISDG